VVLGLRLLRGSLPRSGYGPGSGGVMRDLLIFLAVIAVASLTFWLGRDSAPPCNCPKCEPKIVRGEYSTEELHRMIRARKRMEAVK
jgi:hypothetical protein